MNLSIDEALQQGIEAHRAGRVTEADRLYTAILAVAPDHSDANHNMGVLAVGVGKVEEALPFFNMALEANVRVGQYWLSYIDALIKLDRMDAAKEVLEQAKSMGAEGNGFDQIEKRIKDIGNTSKFASSVQEPSQEQVQPLITLYSKGEYQAALDHALKLLTEFPNSINLYNIAGAANRYLGKLEEAIVAYNKAISIKPEYADAYNNIGNALKDQGKLGEALVAYNKAISIKPEYADAYNNMGVTLHEQGKLEEAIEAYNKTISINPNYADAYSNMGVTLHEQGKLEEAIETYNKTISINPNSVDAYNNIGVTLKEQGKLEEAIEAYYKAISIKPEYAEAYNNIGIVRQAQGKSRKAIEAYKKAISIKPDDSEAWNNLYFALHALKTKMLAGENINLLYPKGIKSDFAKIELGILDYKLNRGQKSESISLDKAMSILSISNNTIIQALAVDKNIPEKTQIAPDKIVALIHFGRSGTGLMHSLIDGHPEVSTLPSIYFSEYFDNSTWMKIISAGWNGMVDRFIDIYEVLFDPTSLVPIATKSKKLQYNIGVKEGLANVGNERNEILCLDKKIFRSELKSLLKCYEEIDAFVFFKLIHVAYDRAINDYNSKSLIFYHIHNPDACAKLNFSRLNESTNWLVMVREPIQSCESWIRRSFHKNDYSGVVNRIPTMLFEIDNSIYRRQNTIGVRLEDLKIRPRKTIPALCKWMGIEESHSLYEMTAQGKKWWGDRSSVDYLKDGMEPFGKTSIKRKIGSIFSKNDQFILRTLFYPFSVRFGYATENKEQFKSDLETIRPMIDEMFDFEQKMAKSMRISSSEFINTGSYLYLRSCLIERWDILNEFHTYPNMIKPLKV